MKFGIRLLGTLSIISLANIFLPSTSLREIPPEKRPSRSCGDIISIATVQDIQNAAKSLISAFLNESSTALILVNIVQEIVQYDVQAQVVCGSCQDVMLDSFAESSSFTNNKNNNNNTNNNHDTNRFQPSFYCNSSQFASNVTYSNLLLLPLDPATNSSISGVLKSHVFLHSYRGDEQLGAPSEFWLDDFSVLNTNQIEDLQAIFANFYDGISSLFMASSGVVVVAPDYLGYGQSYQSPKGFAIVDLYQQAVAVAFLQSKKIVESTNCTRLSKDTSTYGYSEGGIASVVAAKTLHGLGQTILYVGSGGSPYKLSWQMLYSIQQSDQGVQHDSLYPLFAVGMTSFSSNIPNLINTNRGQNVINDNWRELLIALTKTSISTDIINQYIPDPITDIVETNVLKKARVRIINDSTLNYYFSLHHNLKILF
jgi:hypothetical protein